MAKIIAFINEKGGIGKTSVCFNAAWELANTKKILMIDLDAQRSNLTFFCGIKKPDDLITMYDVLKKGASIKKAIKTVKKNLDIVPATVDVADITQTVKVIRMKEALREVANDYDYIFIDVSPDPDWRHFLALSASDYVNVIMLPDMASLESNNGIIESINEVKENTNPNLKVLGILFNRNEDRSNMSKLVKNTAEKFAEKMNTKIYKSKIRNAVVLGEIVAMHIGVTEYDSKSAAANDVRAFVKEMIEECE